MGMLLARLLLPISGLCLLTVEGTPQVIRPLRGAWHGSLAWEQAESGVGTAGSVLGFALERVEAGERKAMPRPGRGKGRMDLGERPAPSPVRRELSCLGT